MISDGGLAIVAGSDTIATVLSNLFWFLLCNPAVYERLQAEVDTLGEDLLNTSRHAQMPYLSAVMCVFRLTRMLDADAAGDRNETLRLLPPLLSGSQRAPAKGSGGKTVGPQ